MIQMAFFLHNLISPIALPAQIYYVTRCSRRGHFRAVTMNTAEAQCPVRRNNKSGGNAIVHHSVCTSCGPCSHQKNTATQMTDKERQCPLSWSPFPALNMLNCLLDISIQWEWKALDFIAPGKVKRVPSWLIHMTPGTANNLLPWRDALENPASFWPPPLPPPFPGVTGTRRAPHPQD